MPEHEQGEEATSRQAPGRGVLFLCVGNSCRSQMAEGFARRHAPPGVAVYSAGSHPAGLNATAVRVMAEAGVDISDQRSKRVDEVPFDDVDVVVTLCAEEVCPTVPPGVRRLDWAMPDPVSAEGVEGEVLDVFRSVRDRIAARVEELFEPPAS